jgi:hypothetical protein
MANSDNAHQQANGHHKQALLARLSSRDFPNKRVGLKNLIQAVLASAAVTGDENDDLVRLSMAF